jgi:hypothetical protein
MNVERPTSSFEQPTAKPADSATRPTVPPGQHQYKVRIGHTEMVVAGHDASEAVENARRQLAGELPRLWDVIYRMSAEEFRVEEVR